MVRLYSSTNIVTTVTIKSKSANYTYASFWTTVNASFWTPVHAFRKLQVSKLMQIIRQLDTHLWQKDTAWPPWQRCRHESGLLPSAGLSVCSSFLTGFIRLRLLTDCSLDWSCASASSSCMHFIISQCVQPCSHLGYNCKWSCKGNRTCSASCKIIHQRWVSGRKNGAQGRKSKSSPKCTEKSHVNGIQCIAMRLDRKIYQDQG